MAFLRFCFQFFFNKRVGHFRACPIYLFLEKISTNELILETWTNRGKSACWGSWKKITIEFLKISFKGLFELLFFFLSKYDGKGLKKRWLFLKTLHFTWDFLDFEFSITSHFLTILLFRIFPFKALENKWLTLSIQSRNISKAKPNLGK